jgi:pimeloyl-ACP methyl ester carboxylesterase
VSLSHTAPAPSAASPLFPVWPSQRVELGGLTLNVRSAPAATAAAEPGLLVHGLGGSSLNWTDLMGLLTDRLDSRAPDLPGFGYSPPPDDGDYSVPGHARAVVRLIEADGRGPVHLFGNSLGGAVATVVAATRPDLVRTLTLVSPAMPDFRPGRWRLPVGLLAVPGVGTALSRRLAEMTPEERVDGLLELCFADPGVVPPVRRQEAIDDVVHRQSLPYAVEALSASTRGLMRSFLARDAEGLWAHARRVAAPTLLLYGRLDRLVSHHVTRRAKATYPGSRLVLLPRTGHVAQMEHPTLVARLVRDHLDRAAAASRAQVITAG